MDKLVDFLMVGLGGAAGSMLRYACSLTTVIVCVVMAWLGYRLGQSR